jgi:hypothetical protein
MQEINPAQSGYSDRVHIATELDKAIGAYMYTLLTGHCAIDAEPVNKSSSVWRDWIGHKVGYETAWMLMHMRGKAPCFKVMPSSDASTSITLGQDTQLSVSFVNPPTANVTVTVTTNKDNKVSYSPKKLVFTPQNYAGAQVVNIQRLEGGTRNGTVTISSATRSQVFAFDQIVDECSYTFK